MSFRPNCLWPTRPFLLSEPCIFCQLRPFPQSARRHVSYRPAKHSSQRSSKDLSELRREVDRKARIGHLNKLHKELIVPIRASKADSIYRDFLALNDKTDPANNVLELAKKYNIDLEFISAIAIGTFSVPDAKDPTMQKLLQGHPSKHASTASQMLRACALAKEPLAVQHILSAVLWTGDDTLPAAATLSRFFSQADIVTFKKIMEELALKGNTEAMTLMGQFLEKAGKNKEARAIYEKAVKECATHYDYTAKMPLSLPIVQPWNALSHLLRDEKAPEAQATVRAALEKGAYKCDDPLAYYQLTAFEDSKNVTWLKCMTKAAASGHVEAMYNLGHFYMDLNSDSSSFLKEGKMAKALNWITTFKLGSPYTHAHEWFQVAANLGHKPSMLELAELHDMEGDSAKATAYLQAITEPPSNGKEIWPQLAEQARRRLAGIKRLNSKTT